jgi:hypothetical protein
MTENSRKMAEKKAEKSRHEAPISIVNTEYFARKMVEK